MINKGDLLGSNLLFLLNRKLVAVTPNILMKKVLIFLCFIKVISINAQEIYQSFSAIVENEATGFPMESVHVVNLNIIVGATTNEKGVFEIPAKVNDTLYFSYLGFKPLKVAVTQDMVKFKNSKFKLTELAFALEEIILRPYQLTGYLDIDVKKVPINSAGRYSIPGLPNSGYEGGSRNPYSISKTFATLFNPADYLHNLFGKNPLQMKKLKKMRENDEIKNLLASKFDREILMQLLKIERYNIDDILRNCNYSDNFIKESNDLQILEAISGCYEEYRILKL
jgi:hypothetical protein